MPLLSEDLPSETLVYDTDTHTAYNLESDARSRWKKARNETERRAILLAGVAGIASLVAPSVAQAASHHCEEHCGFRDNGRPCEKRGQCRGRCYFGSCVE